MKGVNEVVQDFEQMFPFGDQFGAVNILLSDHRKVKRLFSQWEMAKGPSRKQQLLDQVIKELTVHESVEEDLVFPIVQDSPRRKVRDTAAKGLEEQHLLRIQLLELAEASAYSPSVNAKMAVLKENVVHHVQEEEKVIFPALKSSGVDLDILGQQILRRKQQLMADLSRRSPSGTSSTYKAKSTTRSLSSAKSKRGKMSSRTVRRRTTSRTKGKMRKSA